MPETIRAQSDEYLQLLREYHELTKNWVVRWYGMGIAWTIAFIASAMIAMLPISRLYFVAKYHEYNAVKTTIELARNSKTHMDIELRGIQVLAAQWNGWLAYWKTWDTVPIVDFYIPDGIKNIEEIK
jgi:hypothetical protein